MKRYSISEAENIRVLGRTTMDSEGLNVFWTGSGIELNATGTELHVEICAGFEGYEPWIEILIDGCLSQRRMLERGKHTLCIFRCMEDGPVRNVKILKATQAVENDPESFVQIQGLVTDGSFVPLEKCSMKLEVIGDSITSGEGMGGSLKENTWNASVFSVYRSYPFLLAEMLHADLHVLSQSGYGVYCSWCGKTKESLPRYYTQVCGVLSGKANEEKGAHAAWDFSAWQPDCIVVNLGTNDSGSFDQAGNVFPDMDWTCPMRVNEDGSMNEEDRQKILQAVISFLHDLRRYNPSAQIIWCYGMLGGRMEGTLREAVGMYLEETGDKRVRFQLLPDTREGEFGCRSHPGAPSHRKAAEVLYQTIRNLRGEEQPSD